MTVFLANILAFPTVTFSILLGIALLYWLMSLTPLSHPALRAVTGTGCLTFGGLMASLGLKGIRFPLLLLLILWWAWLTTYSVQVLFAPWLKGLLGIVVGCVLIPVALLLGLLLNALLMRLFQVVLVDTAQPTQTRILGCVCGVRSAVVDEYQGTAETRIDGVLVTVQVRSHMVMLRGSKAVLVEYDADKNLYWIMPETEFLTGSHRSLSLEE